MALADGFAQARGTADHLVIENAAVHATQEDDVADRRHIHPGAEEFHGDGHIGESFILEAANQILGLLAGAGDLDHGVIGDAAITWSTR